MSLLNKTYQKAFQYQVDAQTKMQRAGLNLITCCNCDAVLIHERAETKVVCYDCLHTVNPNDCCDYFYTGMEIGEVSTDNCIIRVL